jgi:UDP:flavonoid glycosyltransferase YjiC (YdhE family)
MKIILVSIGTRGDMEPFLALGELLRGKGHQVIFACPEQFRDLALDSNLECCSLGTGFIDLLESDAGKAALGGSSSGLRKLLANVKLARDSTAVNKELIHKQYELIEGESPDRVVYNGKAIYPVIWGLKNRGKNILLCPVPYMHYVRDRTHLAFNSDWGPLLNKLTYALADFGMVTTTGISARWLKMKENLPGKVIRNALKTNRAVYTLSPSLFTRPAYWGEHLKVLGFHRKKETGHWKPDRDLLSFLELHPKMLLITFGSMTNPEPGVKTRIFIDILERHRIPAIINRASGGLAKPEKHDASLIHFVERIPYEWAFPKMYAVIHHGGSGTTHLALKFGCATLIIPHILDQFVWNRIISEKGAGPRGIKASKINTRNLEPRMLALMNDPSYKDRAEQLASQMEKEDFREDLYRYIVT